MIDLHCHPLPGIDDGADDLAVAVAMCHAAAADGCTVMVATPHQRHHAWPNLDQDALRQLLAHVSEAVEGTVDLRLGGEIRVDSELLDELATGPESGIQSLAGSRYLLLEYDRSGVGPEPESLIHELVVQGWRPILAHPEFIPRLGEDMKLMRRLVERGAMLQLTAMSVTGDFGRRAHQLAHRLLDAELVHFVASDAHGVDWRPPGLSEAYQVITEQWGETVARRLMLENPQAVVEDRPLVSSSATSSKSTRDSTLQPNTK